MLDRTRFISDVICLSHLRWRFVSQRPRHLFTRCAREHRVFFVEEPRFDIEGEPISTSRRTAHWCCRCRWPPCARCFPSSPSG
jgi:hypothetical protein